MLQSVLTTFKLKSMIPRKEMSSKIKLFSPSLLWSRSLWQQHHKKQIIECYRILKNPTNTHMKIIVSPIFTSSMKSFLERKEMVSKKELIPREQQFIGVKTRDKETFLKLLSAYDTHDTVRRGHIELIYAALKYMEDFGLLQDLEAYNKVLDVFPKGKMIPKSLIQAEFNHYARHQDCALFALDLMEHHGIVPDDETKDILLATFGKSSHVYKKYARMMYWMPKLKNINPYQLPEPLPLDARELARLALKKMSVDKRTVIEEYDAEKLEDSLDKTWIMSAQSPVQKKLIKNHSEEKALFVEGPSLVWMRRVSMTYFVLRADPIIYPKVEVDEDDVSDLRLYMFGEPKPQEMILAPSSVHEQEDGVILAMCCTGTSSKDSLLSWIRFLRETNPKLDNITILFKIRTTPTALVAINVEKRPVSDKSPDDESDHPQETENQGTDTQNR